MTTNHSKNKTREKTSMKKRYRKMIQNETSRNSRAGEQFTRLLKIIETGHTSRSVLYSLRLTTFRIHEEES
jgi:uncharacterized protein YgbK (DUF1537 family)